MNITVQYMAFAVLAVVMILVSAPILGILAVQQQDSSRRFLFGALASSIWTLIFQVAEIFAPSQTFAMVFSSIGYAGIVSVTPLWLSFVCSYVGQSSRRPWIAAIPFVVPLLTILVIATNFLHGLYWTDISFEKVWIFSVLHRGHGPWFWVFVIHAYLLVMIACLLIALDFVVSSSYFSRQAICVALAALLPLASNMLYLFNPFPGISKDFTPIAFCMTILTVAVCIRRYHLFDMMPMGYRIALDTFTDAILIVDGHEHIVDANESARKLFDLSLASMGRPISDFPLLASIPALEPGGEYCLGDGDFSRFFDLRRKPLVTGRSSLVLYSFHETTEQKRHYLEKCELVDQLTNALAEIKDLQGIIPICASCKKVRDDSGYWHQVESYISSHSSAEFSHSLCPDCAHDFFGDMAEEPAASAVEESPAGEGPSRN